MSIENLAKQNLDNYKQYIWNTEGFLSSREIEWGIDAFSPYLIPGYFISPRKVLAANNVLRISNRLMRGEFKFEAYGEISDALKLIKKETPNLDSFLLYHFAIISTPQIGSCRFFDIDECPKTGLFGKLCNIEHVYQELEKEHNHKNRNR